MDTFLNDVTRYLKEENNIEKILALTLRDIFLNDLIYITFSDEWQQYNISKKEWSKFDINTFLKKLDFLVLFYEHDLSRYINNTMDDGVDKTYLLKKVKHVTNYISKFMDNDDFIRKCQTYFRVGT